MTLDKTVLQEPRLLNCAGEAMPTGLVARGRNETLCWRTQRSALGCMTGSCGQPGEGGRANRLPTCR